MHTINSLLLLYYKQILFSVHITIYKKTYMIKCNRTAKVYQNKRDHKKKPWYISRYIEVLVMKKVLNIYTIEISHEI